MRKIFEFYWDCGRQGELNGLFTADDNEVAAAIGKDIYFGEVLGKHSEIYGELEAEDITVKSEDQDFISKFEELLGSGTISGFNPLDYVRGEEAVEC